MGACKATKQSDPEVNGKNPDVIDGPRPTRDDVKTRMHPEGGQAEPTMVMPCSLDSIWLWYRCQTIERENKNMIDRQRPTREDLTT